MSSARIDQRSLDPPLEGTVSAAGVVPAGPEDSVSGHANLAGAVHLPSDDRTVISKRPPISLGQTPVSTSPQLMGTTLVGQRLEHYELIEFVGGGGMGAVFRATDTRLGRTVAVKVLSRDHTDDETIRRFRNEAQNAARLDHPNIARVYYVGEDRGWNYIVFEYIEGINLRDLVDQEGPLDTETALRYTLQVAEALDHASSRDIVHRDIKPSNVLVTTLGTVKLVDMGLARLHQVESGADDLTASGVTLGTFDYISPEQARDPREADVRSDIYSLGCTLYFMLSGQPPFPDGTALQKLLRHNSDDPLDVREFRPDVDPLVSTLLGRMLAKRPSQREQSPGELIAEIVDLGRQLGLKSIAELHPWASTESAAAPAWRHSLLQTAVAMGLFVAAVVVMELVLSPRNAGGDLVLQPQFKKVADETTAPPTPPSAPIVESLSGAPLVIESKQVIDSDTVGARMASPNFSAEAPASSLTANMPQESIGAAGTIVPESHTPTVDTAVPSAIDLPRGKKIVVLADALAPPEPGTEYLSGLAEAVERAVDLGLQEIELRFNGPKVFPALEVTAQRLAIRAAPGFTPVVVFRPEVGLSPRQMIRMAEGISTHAEFADLELRLELPVDPPSDGWALIALGTGQSLQFHGCVLTVVDGDEQRLPIHDQVAMIALERRRASDSMSLSEPQLAMGQQARVTMERTIARGEASLINVVDETPLTIRWNQGLLVTSKRLIETSGSSSDPQYYEQIVLDLDRVTAVARQGLYRLQRGLGKTSQFHVNSYADRCIIVADAGSPMFEMVGLGAPPETDELQSIGDGNRFWPVDMPFLFVRQTAGSEPFVARLGRKWSSETRSQAGVPWLQSPPFERPAHEMTKNDFLVEVEDDEDFAGFDPALMPDVWQSNRSSDPNLAPTWSDVGGNRAPRP